MQIAVFKNRVEIRNPGGLFGGLTIEEIRKGNVSKRRNPLIAELLHRIHMVEAWGRGMPLILRNAPDVKFREVAGIFIAGFNRPSFVAAEKDGSIDKAAKETIKEITKEEAASPKETILNVIRERPGISVKELAGLCGLSPHGVQYHINKLKESGVIRHVGATKAGRWEILHDE